VVRDGLYLGVFRVNPLHNLLHVATGVMFLIASAAGPLFVRLWLFAFGTFYGALAGVGLVVGDGMICGISNNGIDAWGHAGLALGMLAIGFWRLKRIGPASSHV
jgi:hypothetical protein